MNSSTKWALYFYEKQFQFYAQTYDDTHFYEEISNEITNQVGKEFKSVLDLGSGNGKISNAFANMNKNVTAIELVPEIANFAKKNTSPKIKYINGDFHNISFKSKFDLIVYIDGFGVGNDEAQLHLLDNIHSWLNDAGVALIDIYNPNYWKEVVGVVFKPDPASEAIKEYGYDYEKERMKEKIWIPIDKNNVIFQTLACYSPEKISLMCESRGLEIIDIFPGGAMDFENWIYKPTVSLKECLTYRIKITKKV